MLKGICSHMQGGSRVYLHSQQTVSHTGWAASRKIQLLLSPSRLPPTSQGAKIYISFFFRQWQRDRPKLGANYIYLSDLFAGKLEQQEDRHWTETPRGNFILQNKPRACRKHNVERPRVCAPSNYTHPPRLSHCRSVSVLSWKGSGFLSGLSFTRLHSQVLLRTI